MLPIAVVITGDPVETVHRTRGGWAEIVRLSIGELWPNDYLTADARQGELPSLDRVSALIVTGSASSVTSREPWILHTEEYLAGAVRERVPVLGICFGHQLLGQALGGQVRQNPRGREIGTVLFERVTDDPLFGGEPAFAVNMTHVDTVLELPREARVLGRTELEPHAAVRFAERAWGVQFHPEIDGEIMKRYVEARRELIDAEGLDGQAILEAVVDAPRGASVLRRFIEHSVLGR
ncbi:MAG TPA: glutamine amidotransferase [Polyangiaceae bacterium]|jgi:GMP synthase (glutamine-hydrolysing)